MAAEDVHKTAITTRFNLYEFLRMPFGRRNDAQSFQRLIDEALRKFSQLMTLRQHRRYVGSINYYCHFIPNFSQILGPLTNLL